MNKKEFHDRIHYILGDKTSGSTIIADEIEKIFPFIPKDIFIPTIKKLIATHSSMASVINRINYLCLKMEGEKIHRKRVFKTKIFADFWDEHRTKMNWITLSMSHWIIECFKYNKNRLNLKIGISYPAKEGLITFDLLKNIHRAEIYEDCQLGFEVRQADGILLGADLISKNAVINKTGSFFLALAAKYFKKPLYIMSSGDKFLSSDLFDFFKTKSKKKKSGLFSYFEPIPLDLVSNIYLTTAVWDFPLSATLRKIS